MLGIFDSGIGGLTVVRELLKRHQDASFLYLGDTARTPYGNKSKETIARYAVEDARFLVSHGADTLVVACNSMSAYAMDALATAFPSLRIFEVITPAVRRAAEVTRGSVGVIGTRATIGSGIYEQRLKESGCGCSITSVACPLFVPLAEEGWLDGRETKQIARRYLAPLKAKQVDTLILGCTHYPLLTPVIRQRIGRRVRIIDSASAVVDEIESARAGGQACVRASLFVKATGDRGEQRYFFTDENPRTADIARKWLGRAIMCERAEVGG
jgi:glutamate racemase